MVSHWFAKNPFMRRRQTCEQLIEFVRVTGGRNMPRRAMHGKSVHRVVRKIKPPSIRVVFDDSDKDLTRAYSSGQSFFEEVEFDLFSLDDLGSNVRVPHQREAFSMGIGYHT
jgi:hypothetical protein